MIFFERLATGWELAKQSMGVLNKDKEMLMFPLFSGICCLIVMATFAVPLFLSGAFQSMAEEGEKLASNVLFYVILFAFYFVNYFVIIFFNSALVGCAIIRLKGGDPTVRDGFSAATARLPQIAAWALVAATVGFILKAIENNSEKFGQIVAGLIGMAWSITTFFVIPVIVIEKTGPIDAIKRSVSIMKKSWGESLAANFSISIITFLLSLLGLVLILPGVFCLVSGMTVLGVILIVLGVIWILLVSLISSALGSIILAALYIYAAEGRAPNHFDQSMIRSAFASR